MGRKPKLIVFDEASQVKAMDAFLCLECSGKGTRFLLVGDDNQLPPIIQGQYRREQGEKYIYGSIFDLYLSSLRKKDPNHQDIIQLNDNFRMNGILCKYSAIKLYEELEQSSYELDNTTLCIYKKRLK
ncbi:MAG: AAA family ATPase [Ruminococcus sp.]|nr:AAA family ATPase [Ruminococcus sp.]